MLGRRSPAAPAPRRGPRSTASADAARHQVPDAPIPYVAPGDGPVAGRHPRADPPRARHRHRARHGLGADLIGRVAWPLAAVALVAVVGARAAQRAVRPDEGRLVADAFILSGTDGATAAPALSPDGLGALHVAVYATLTRTFDRHDTLVQAGRELLLIVAICSALLLWRTARRIGLRVPAAAAAVVLAGLPALLSAAALIDIPAQLAVPWLLLAAWLTASGQSTGTARAVALRGHRGRDAARPRRPVARAGGRRGSPGHRPGDAPRAVDRGARVGSRPAARDSAPAPMGSPAGRLRDRERRPRSGRGGLRPHRRPRRLGVGPAARTGDRAGRHDPGSDRALRPPVRRGRVPPAGSPRDRGPGG